MPPSCAAFLTLPSRFSHCVRVSHAAFAFLTLSSRFSRCLRELPPHATFPCPRLSLTCHARFSRYLAMPAPHATLQFPLLMPYSCAVLSCRLCVPPSRAAFSCCLHLPPLRALVVPPAQTTHDIQCKELASAVCSEHNVGFTHWRSYMRHIVHTGSGPVVDTEP
eukprot:364260-Chlamydomonas_euryale.AAC.8